MRYVICPASVKVMSPDGLSPLKVEKSDGSAATPLVIDMREFFERFVVNDPKFGRSVKTMRSASDLLEAVAGKEAGDVVKLSDADWDVAKDVLENPSTPFQTYVFRQCLPLANAFLDAKTADPAKAVEVEKLDSQAPAAAQLG